MNFVWFLPFSFKCNSLILPMEVPAEGSAPTGVDMGIEPADCRGGRDFQDLPSESRDLFCVFINYLDNSLLYVENPLGYPQGIFRITERRNLRKQSEISGKNRQEFGHLRPGYGLLGTDRPVAVAL